VPVFPPKFKTTSLARQAPSTRPTAAFQNYNSFLRNKPSPPKLLINQTKHVKGKSASMKHRVKPQTHSTWHWYRGPNWNLTDYAGQNQNPADFQSVDGDKIFRRAGWNRRLGLNWGVCSLLSKAESTLVAESDAKRSIVLEGTFNREIERRGVTQVPYRE
jgi:hypothetical protein